MHFSALIGDDVAIHPILFHQLIDTVPVSGWQVVRERDELRVLLSGVQNGVHDDTLRTSLQQTLVEQSVIIPVLAYLSYPSAK